LPPTPPLQRQKSMMSRPLYCQVRPAEILLPAWGSANDAARVRNIGKPLRRQDFDEGPAELRSSASAPSLAPTATASGRRTRRERPVLKQISQISTTYPEWNPLSLEGRFPIRKEFSKDSIPSPKVKPRPKIASWTDLPEPEIDYVLAVQTNDSQVGMPTVPLHRSMKLMQKLHDLRRCNRLDQEPQSPKEEKQEEKARSPSPPPKSPKVRTPLVPVTDVGEDESPLMLALLKDTTDRVEKIREKMEKIELTTGMVSLCGGTCHASNIVSLRTLGCFKRKTELLRDVETRLAAFEEAHSRKDEIREKVIKGMDPPEALLGHPAFVQAYTHSPGEPVDAPRSDFKAFVISFKLPSKHELFETFRAHFEEYGTWWAKATSEEANKGANREQILRMIAISEGSGARPDHPYLLRARKQLIDRVAEKTVKGALWSQERDEAEAKKEEAQGRLPRVGPASDFADGIEAAIAKAITEDVPKNDARLREAQAVAKHLRELDGERKRMVNREKRMQEQARKAQQK